MIDNVMEKEEKDRAKCNQSVKNGGEISQLFLYLVTLVYPNQADPKIIDPFHEKQSYQVV